MALFPGQPAACMHARVCVVWCVCRGNKYKLAQHHCHYDLKKYNFTNRVIPIWNGLCNYVVSVGTVNTFKSQLDKVLVESRCVI